MYEQNENPWSRQEEPPKPAPSGNLFATAALVCAILSIVSVCCLYGAFVFGGLAIVFGLLSKGSRKRTSGTARTALCLGLAGVLISIVITVSSFVYAVRQYGSLQNLMDAYIYTLENSFGIDLDENTTEMLDSDSFL